MVEPESVIVRPPEMIGGNIFVREESDPFTFQLHKHDHMCELYLVERGEGEFAIDGRTYRAGPGTLLFYQRGQWHEEKSTAHPFKGMFIACRGMVVKGLPADYFLPPDEPPVLELGEHAPRVAEAFERCIREFLLDEPEARTVASHLLGALVAQLARLVHYRNAPAAAVKASGQAVLTARRYIEENYRLPLTLEQLARMTYVNPYYLVHLFTEEMGVSPIRYLIRCRMEAAKRYLTVTRYPVRQVAELVGYQSETTFQSTFKKVTGMTPGHYRRHGGSPE